MVQYENLQRIKRLINLMRLYITCEKSGGLHLVEPCRQAGSPAEEIWVRLEILKVCNIQFSASFSQGTA